MTSSSLTLLGALDPTYSLTPTCLKLVHGDLPAYLRLYHLFFGSLVIPRTYLIHGRTNLFFELYKSGPRGKKEIQEFLQSSGALISGHNGEGFKTLDGHLKKTIEEGHPLVFDEDQRIPYACKMQDWIPPQSVVLQDFSRVIKGFPDVFQDYFLSYEHMDMAGFQELDAKLKELLAERNPKNNIKYDIWGRNEVCDFIRTLPSGDPIASRLADCAVATYQHTFAQSFPIDFNVFLNSGAPRNSTEESTDLTGRLHDDLKNSQTWEINLAKLSASRWKDIRALSEDRQWSSPRLDFKEALAARDQQKALDALNQLIGVLRKEFRPNAEGARASVRLIMDDVVNNPLVAIGIGIIGRVNQSDLELYILSGQGLLVAADQLYAKIKQSRREKRLRFHLDYLCDDWKSKLPRI